MNKAPSRSIWVKASDSKVIEIVDQRALPHELLIAELSSTNEAASAIREMWVRGAPLIGATAGYGMYLAVLEAEGQSIREMNAYLDAMAHKLMDTRPTAVNLQWAIRRQLEAIQTGETWEEKRQLAFDTASAIVEEDVAICRNIGEHGLEIIRKLAARKPSKPIHILTHCNAGRMATVEWGTATAPIYLAHEAGIPIHVWVDETRPRNQGARITAWELAEKKIPHTVIVDNVGGHLMQHGQVDLCIVGTDRTTRQGDVANKIGTYLKALAAYDNQVPFYVALPSSTIDWELRDGIKEIPIEERDDREVKYIYGWDEDMEEARRVRLTPIRSKAANFAFDVTPARLVTGLITERGVAEASEAGLVALFPEYK